jgi:hypothetical protein
LRNKQLTIREEVKSSHGLRLSSYIQTVRSTVRPIVLTFLIPLSVTIALVVPMETVGITTLPLAGTGKWEISVNCLDHETINKNIDSYPAQLEKCIQVDEHATRYY